MRSKKKFACLRAAAFLLLFGVATTLGQSVAESSSAPPGSTSAAGVITGVVLGDDGRPLFSAEVSLSRKGSARDEKPITIDVQPDGSFRFTGVGPGLYQVWAHSRGYLNSDFDLPAEQRVSYRAGANVTQTLVKGGAITGTLFDVNGAPVANARVTAIRMRDASRRKLPLTGYNAQTYTDDRGIYRIFGLPGGSYTVVVGAMLGTFNEMIGEGFALEGVPTYHPSASAETAAEVVVALGQETSGIDIRARGIRGRTVSGTIVGELIGNGSFGTRTHLRISRADNGVPVAFSDVRNVDGENGFAVEDVPDGEYLVSADRVGNGTVLNSPWQLIKVKGADVTGLRLNLANYGFINGRLQLESNSGLAKDQTCSKGSNPPRVGEVVLSTHLDTHTRVGELQDLIRDGSVGVEPSGTFSTTGLSPGSYWFDFDLPDERLYVRSITRPSPDGKLVEASSTALSVTSGQTVTNLTAIVSDGAAGIRGTVSRPKRDAPVPPRTLLHLIPSEPGTADAVLRYYETATNSDGVFALTNVAPGKYWIYAEAIPDTGMRDSFRRPAAWDAAARLKLRRAAETANVSVELHPCQRVTDFVLRLAARP